MTVVSPALIRRFRLERARTMDEAVRLLSAGIGKDIVVVERAVGPGVWGLAVRYPRQYVVIVNSSRVFGPGHRDHILSHEIAHVLQWEDEGDPRESLVELRCSMSGDDSGEREAEILGGRLMVAINESRGVGNRLAAVERYR